VTNEIEIDGTRYVLAAAVPYITNGFFSLKELFRILAERGDYFAENGQPLDVSLYYAFADGRLVEEDHDKMKRAAAESSAATGPPGWVANLAETTMINSDALEGIFRIHLANELAKPAIVRRNMLGVVWDINAPVPVKTGEKRSRFLRARERRLVARNASKAAKQKSVEAAVENAIRIVSAAYPAFDRLQIPGGVERFATLIRKIDPTLRELGTGTLRRTYFRDIGIGFKEGRQPDGLPEYLIQYERLTRPPS